VKKVIFIFMLIYSSFLFATDVSNFDIKGIKLGMSKNEALKRIPCMYQKTYNDEISEQGKCINKDEIYYLQFIDNYVSNISRTKKIPIQPNDKILYKKIYRKYGIPDKKSRYKFKNEYMDCLCYGQCSTPDSDGFIHLLDKGKGFLIYYGNMTHSYDNFLGDYIGYAIIFELRDYEIIDNYMKRLDNMEKRKIEDEKKKASNIDL